MSAATQPPAITEDQVEFAAIRAQGPGGQNVNKVSNAVHLRFDVGASALAADVKARLLVLAGRRASRFGVIVIKAQSARSLESNKAQALARLNALVAEAAREPVPRKPTRPTRASRLRRLETKAQHGQLKASRAKVVD